MVGGWPKLYIAAVGSPLTSIESSASYSKGHKSHTLSHWEGWRAFKKVSRNYLLTLNESLCLWILPNRLKNANITFTACPTDQEIEDARRETERKKSLDEIDPSLILESKRKRGAETEESAKRPKDSSHGSSTSKSRVVVSDDEEAEF